MYEKLNAFVANQLNATENVAALLWKTNMLLPSVNILNLYCILGIRF